MIVKWYHTMSCYSVASLTTPSYAIGSNMISPNTIIIVYIHTYIYIYHIYIYIIYIYIYTYIYIYIYY